MSNYSVSTLSIIYLLFTPVFVELEQKKIIFKENLKCKKLIVKPIFSPFTHSMEE